MRQAFSMLGILTVLMVVGVYLAFHKDAEAPVVEKEVMQSPMSLTLTSPVFEHNSLMPSKYTCDGEDVSPELRISGVPEGVQSFVLVMDDPDIPESVKQSRGISKFDHWAVYNIPADTAVIEAGKSVGTGALNSLRNSNYKGPCPPDGEHRYIFRLYALSGTLNFIQAPTLDELETAAKGMMLEQAELIGRYSRSVRPQ